MDLNKIFSNLKFENITKVSNANILELLKIRNQKNIRAKMFSKNFITKKDHYLWINKIKKNKKEDFFIIFYKDSICGGLGIKNIDKKLNDCDWAFYLSNEFNFPGLGASIEFKSINFIFDKYKLSRIYCYVLKDNKSVINLHIKFFFTKTPLVESKLNNYNINFSKNNVIKFCLDLKKWKIKSKKLITKFNIYGKKI